MTEITDAAIEEALRRSGLVYTAEIIREFHGDKWADTILAHAQTITEVSDAVYAFIDRTEGECSDLWKAYTKEHLSRFILPKVDPDEALAREIARERFPASEFDVERFGAEQGALAAIKRLRAIGGQADD